MKIQGLSIIYILIVLPIFFVISMTVVSYAKIINARLDYDKKVYTAVQDAVKAFEINTSNENFSKVSDVLRTIVDASVATFKNSLGTELGMSNVSKQYIDTYFPIGLFTLYDGYYITSPTREPVMLLNGKGQPVHLDDPGLSYEVNGDKIVNIRYDIKAGNPEEKEEERDGASVIVSKNANKPVVFLKAGSNGREYTTEQKDAEVKITHKLKNYTPYSTKYKYKFGDDLGDTESVSISYTLDNYLNITLHNGRARHEEHIGGGYGIDSNFAYSTKSGYLLNQNTEVQLDTGYTTSRNLKILASDRYTGTDRQIELYVDEARAKGKKIGIIVKNDQFLRFDYTADGAKQLLDSLDYMEVRYDPQDDVPESAKPKRTAFQNQEKYLEALNEYNAKRAYADQQISAIKYYLKAQRFSDWVYAKFSKLKESDIIIDQPESVVEEYKKVDVFNEYNSDEYLFSGEVNQPSSVLNTHKAKVIKDSILYNLLVASINYNQQKFEGVPIYELPLIAPKDWEKIIGNISFTAFMEGLGEKRDVKYNNYMTAKSTKNDFNIADNNIVFVQKEAFNEGAKYVENKDENILPYYYSLYSEEFTDNAKMAKNANKKFIGEKRTRFELDGDHDKSTQRQYYDHKNLADISITQEKVKEIRELTNLQKRIYLVGTAGERERLFKFIKPDINGTLTTGHSLYQGRWYEGEDEVIKIFKGYRTKNSTIDEFSLPMYWRIFKFFEDGESKELTMEEYDKIRLKFHVIIGDYTWTFKLKKTKETSETNLVTGNGFEVIQIYPGLEIGDSGGDEKYIPKIINNVDEIIIRDVKFVHADTEIEVTPSDFPEGLKRVEAILLRFSIPFGSIYGA